MAKYEHFVAIMVGLTLLFYFTGLLGNDTPNSALLNLMLDPEGFQARSIWVDAFAIFSGVGLASAIVIGFFSGSNTKVIAVSIFIISFSALLWDFLSVVAKVVEVNPVIGILLFSPLLILYALGAINWWGAISS